MCGIRPLIAEILYVVELASRHCEVLRECSRLLLVSVPDIKQGYPWCGFGVAWCGFGGAVSLLPCRTGRPSESLARQIRRWGVGVNEATGLSSGGLSNRGIVGIRWRERGERTLFGGS